MGQRVIAERPGNITMLATIEHAEREACRVGAVPVYTLQEYRQLIDAISAISIDVFYPLVI